MICDILLPDRRTLADYSASGPCECGDENPIFALKLFWFFASLTVSVNPFVLDSAKVPTNEYDAFLFRLIIPFKEHCHYLQLISLQVSQGLSNLLSTNICH
ncbi:MAG TPA: hypothetical protein VFI70_11760 [Nitrososphaeraceae archaeon]|nr:hypothetical protein [Nitrososphaeraceae archaeon]